MVCQRSHHRYRNLDPITCITLPKVIAKLTANNLPGDFNASS